MVTPAEQTPPIFRLPDELFVEIFKKIPDPRLALVCTKFRQIMNDEAVKRFLLQNMEQVFPYGKFLEWKNNGFLSFPIDNKLRVAYSTFLDLTKQRIPYQYIGKRPQILFDYQYFQMAASDHRMAEYLNLVAFCRFFIGGQILIEGILSSSIQPSKKAQLIKVKLQEFLVQRRLELDLSFRQIKEIPREIGVFVALTKLVLGNNSLTFLPEEIGNLQNLLILSLTQNNLEFFPETLWNLRTLLELNLSNNPIQVISEDIGKLENLRDLNLSVLQIKQIPAALSKLKQLTRLNLSCNFQLVELSDRLADIPSLRELDIHHCPNINTLPAWIGKLVNLRSLSLHKTGITSLPNEFVNLVNLQRLSLPIGVRQLPPGMERLTNLQYVKIYKDQKDPIGRPLKRLFPHLVIEYSDRPAKKTFSQRVGALFGSN